MFLRERSIQENSFTLQNLQPILAPEDEKSINKEQKLLWLIFKKDGLRLYDKDIIK
jgi:hypothetical protein